MTTRILHVSAGYSGMEMMDKFVKANPHGKFNWTDRKVETFGVVHYFRRIRSMDDCYKLAGINFNSIIVYEIPPDSCLLEWLMSRCREPIIRPAGSPTLTLTVAEKEENL